MADRGMVETDTVSQQKEMMEVKAACTCALAHSCYRRRREHGAKAECGVQDPVRPGRLWTSGVLPAALLRTQDWALPMMRALALTLQRCRAGDEGLLGALEDA